ncbi:MAG: nucleotidyl transferase AbiEii/AbiGii toxin family protein [Patescibacteria group bacterium]|nr:nucleotidyl transferase AbiEii/AbiGii toxin family protein [Patescibacteria group bacterium]
MISLAEIQKFYPSNLWGYERSLLKEYLQYKILQSLFNTVYANKLCFIGGTALKIVYGNTRFSEDLDFDNFGIEKGEFDDIANTVKRDMELEGYEVEIRNVFKGAYRCYIKFPKLLFDLGLSGHEEEKVLIQIDITRQEFKYKFNGFILNKFDVFSQINVAPIDILLSQKFCAAFERKNPKGRDFYDIVFLLSKTEPNYEYLSFKLKLKNKGELKKYVAENSKKLDFKLLADDVAPFLMNPLDKKRVELFGQVIESL